MKRCRFAEGFPPCKRFPGFTQSGWYGHGFLPELRLLDYRMEASLLMRTWSSDAFSL